MSELRSRWQVLVRVVRRHGAGQTRSLHSPPTQRAPQIIKLYLSICFISYFCFGVRTTTWNEDWSIRTAQLKSHEWLCSIVQILFNIHGDLKHSIIYISIKYISSKWVPPLGEEWGPRPGCWQWSWHRWDVPVPGEEDRWGEPVESDQEWPLETGDTCYLVTSDSPADVRSVIVLSLPTCTSHLTVQPHRQANTNKKSP